MVDTDQTGGRADGERRERGSAPDDHLAGVADGCGCAEVWEHLSERRADD